MSSEIAFEEYPRALLAAAASGAVYATLVFVWALRTGISFSTDSLLGIAIGGGYAFGGVFLVAAVPAYLLCRLSLVSPAVVAGWSLANTVYLRRFVARPHDALASYLTVWPLFVALIVAAALGESGLRIAADRLVGRFGLRSLC